jgi:alanine racemase
LREAVIDLDAVRDNVAHLRTLIGVPHLMAVVKADAYGHGALPCARAALAGGADLLGVADISEALALRAGGIDAPVLAWLHAPDADFAPAIEAGIELGISSCDQLDRVADAVGRLGSAGAARVQLKLDTGLSRNGVPQPDWDDVFRRAMELESSGAVAVTGMFSHLSGASPEDDLAACARFDAGVEQARRAGLQPALLHIAASAAALTLPQTRYNTVRLGIAIYGLSPFADRTAAQFGLRPALSLRSRVAAVRTVPAGTGVSYDYTYRTLEDATLALVPLGYAEGIPRQASNRGPVVIDGRRFTVSGRIAMDQFVVDVGETPVEIGDEVVLIGDPEHGAPSATDWAEAADTINYEIVTRLGGRIERRYIGSAA